MLVAQVDAGGCSAFLFDVARQARCVRWAGASVWRRLKRLQGSSTDERMEAVKLDRARQLGKLERKEGEVKSGGARQARHRGPAAKKSTACGRSVGSRAAGAKPLWACGGMEAIKVGWLGKIAHAEDCPNLNLRGRRSCRERQRARPTRAHTRWRQRPCSTPDASDVKIGR